MARSIFTPYTFTTLAGAAMGEGVIKSEGSIDGASRSARFFHPSGVTVDGMRNAYVADTDNHTVRKINADGIVTTLVGKAPEVGSVDGAGIAVRFNHPTGIVMDRSGQIYVADTDNHAIRKITVSGVASTFAGSAGITGSEDGQGNAARFTNPRGLAVDDEGAVYVADTGNHTIRKITPEGVVVTLAGSPGLRGSQDGVGRDARFAGPRGVAVDRAGTVYVADTENHTIRQIKSGAVVSTLAGSPGRLWGSDGVGSDTQFSNPNGVAIDAAGNVYVADAGNHAIRRITPEAVVTTLAGHAQYRPAGIMDGSGSAAGFNSPSAVAVDSDGHVFVADTGNNTIRMGVPSLGEPSITFIEQPKNKSVLAGENASFSVVAIGPAPLTYQWQKDGFDLQGAIGTSFTITQAQARDSGAYRVLVSSGTEREHSATANLIVNMPPPNDLFSNRAVITGLQVTLTGNNLNATREPGEPAHGVRTAGKSMWWSWTAPRDGKVTIDTSGSLVFTALAVYVGDSLSSLALVAKDDKWIAIGAAKVTFSASAGTTYQIAVDGEDSIGGNVILNLRFREPGFPEIHSQPESRFLVVGQSATFTVVATGSEPLGYQWKKAGVSIPGATSASYTIQSATASDDGTAYSVLVSNPLGSVTSSPAYLVRNVNPPGVPISVTPVPPPANDLFHNRIEMTGLNVTVTGTNQSATKEFDEPDHGADAAGRTIWWSWTAPRDTTVVIDTLGLTQWSSVLAVYTGNSLAGLTQVGQDARPGVGASRVKLVATAGTTYQIAVDTEYGTSGAVTLNLREFVPGFPEIIVQPASQSVPTGQTVTFSVTAIGSEPLSYQWRRGGWIIPGVNGPSYTIPEAQIFHGDTYFVVVSNSLGAVVSEGARLSFITQNAEITSPLANQTVLEGQSATFSVKAVGSFPMRYLWQKDGVFISGATGSDYTIPRVQRSDAGTYTVLVSNPISSTVTSTATLTVGIKYALRAEHLPDERIRLWFRRADGSLPSNASKLEVQWRSDLPTDADRIWQSVRSGFFIVNDFVVFEDPGTVGQSRRFYRVVER
ncbi:MAG: immunoglobulin domain-containing protein [Verrucomicrobia bacterium]|nr:immunoglobulin domain-containing protein [Verrucomicrobiota bacterium]